MNSIVERYLEWVVKHPISTIVVSLLLVGGCGAGILRLTFDQDYRVFFAEEFPPLTALEQMHDTYNKNDNLLFVVAPASGEVFTPRALSVIQQITREAWMTPFSTRVESLTNFQYEIGDLQQLGCAQPGSELGHSHRHGQRRKLPRSWNSRASLRPR